MEVANVNYVYKNINIIHIGIAGNEIDGKKGDRAITAV